MNLQTESNIRNFINTCNNNTTNMICNNITNLITLLFENGKFSLIVDKRQVLKQYSLDWDIRLLYIMLNQIYNNKTRKLIFNECMAICPDIINYSLIDKNELRKIHQNNFINYYHSLDENSKKEYAKYLSYF